MTLLKRFLLGQTTPKTNKLHAKLGLQTLEQRENPAGVVNISFANNAITLTGDGNVNGNTVWMTATGDDTANNSQFTFTCNDGTQFSVNGGPLQNAVDTASINGFFFPNNGTTKLIVNFGNGNDNFWYNGAESGNIFVRSFGDMSVNSGLGNDFLTFYSSYAKNYLINTGGGNDTIFAYAGAINNSTYNGGASGSFTANLGTGGDFVDLGISTNKNVTINAADAGDTISVNNNSRIGGSLAINVSPANAPGVSVINVGSDSRPINISDNLSIKNGNHNINLTLGNSVNVGRNLSVASGSDAITGSLYTIGFANVGQAISFTGGVGIDRLAIGLMNSGTSTTFNMGAGGNGSGDSLSLYVGSNLTINYGSGNDSINQAVILVGGSASINAGAGVDKAKFAYIMTGGNFSYNGGDGGNGAVADPDIFSFQVTSGNASLITGAGDDAINVQGLVSKNLTISTGAGNDTVKLNSNFINGNITVNSGLGDDLINIDSVKIAGISTISAGGGNDTLNLTGTSNYQQKVTINLAGTGSDNDTLNISPANAGEEMAMLKGLSVISGSGNDILGGGAGAGILMVHNGVSLPSIFNSGSNFFTL